MKYVVILAVVMLGATGCVTSHDLALRDQRIAELTERLEANEAILRNGDIPMVLKLLDEMDNAPIIQVELIGEQ